MWTLLHRNAAAIVALLPVTLICVPSFSHDGAPSASICDRDEDDDDDDLGDAMERVHKGRRSPYRKFKAELEAVAPNFAELQQQLPAFIKMSALLKGSRNKDVSGSADGYATAVRDLAMAVQKRQTAPAQAAFQSLSNSCSDCHYRGGPGGKLD